MKAVYRFNVNCGRMGTITGVFVEKKSIVKMLINYGVGVYFGEILGKHSEVIVMIEEDMIEMISDNEEVVKVVEKYGLSNGYNPFDFAYNGFVFEDVDIFIDSDDIEDKNVRNVCEILLENTNK